MTERTQPPGRQAIRAITRSYEDLVVRLYSTIRFIILRQPFLDEIGQYLPREGRILDLGCGFGMFSLYFASCERKREILGVDLDTARIGYARTSAEKLGLHNVQYQNDDALDWSSDQQFDAIYMLDMIHHLPEARVEAYLTKVRALLREGGTLVIKDVATRPHYKRLFTLVLDRLMVGMEPIKYWDPEDLTALLERLGFSVVRHRMTDFLPYPHILYVGRLPQPR